MSDALRALFSEEQPEPDWADRDAAIDYLLEAERPYLGGAASTRTPCAP